EQLGVDAVDRQPLAEDVLDAPVDLGAGAADVEGRLGADRQPSHRLGVVALVGPPDLLLAQPQRVHDLSGTGDQRDDPQGPPPEEELSTNEHERTRKRNKYVCFLFRVLSCSFVDNPAFTPCPTSGATPIPPPAVPRTTSAAAAGTASVSGRASRGSR